MLLGTYYVDLVHIMYAFVFSCLFPLILYITAFLKYLPLKVHHILELILYKPPNFVFRFI